MKINKQNYVDEAERVIIGLKEADRNGKLALTTSKIRNILSMVSELYTDTQHSREDKLDADMVSRVQYLKMRIAYEAGRDDNGRVHPVKDFVMAAKLMQYIDEIKSRQDLILYCNYMEALVAYHRFYGGHDK